MFWEGAGEREGSPRLYAKHGVAGGWCKNDVINGVWKCTRYKKRSFEYCVYGGGLGSVVIFLVSFKVIGSGACDP